MISFKRHVFAVSCLVLVAGAFPASAEETPAGQCTATGAELAGLMEKTKVNAVSEYSGLPADYNSDGDPETLEIVFMYKKKGLASSVSGDGEVIFLVGKVKDSEQSRLINIAFCLRARARRV